MVKVVNEAILIHTGCASARTRERKFIGKSPGVSTSTRKPSSDWSSSWRLPRSNRVGGGVGIYSGVFTVTEAASVGASLAFFIALARGRMTMARFVESIRDTAT